MPQHVQSISLRSLTPQTGTQARRRPNKFLAIIDWQPEGTPHHRGASSRCINYRMDASLRSLTPQTGSLSDQKAKTKLAVVSPWGAAATLRDFSQSVLARRLRRKLIQNVFKKLLRKMFPAKVTKMAPKMTPKRRKTQNKNEHNSPYGP